MRIISWNVNGVRAIAKKGFLEWVKKTDPDILCLQETKAHVEQLDKSILEVAGYKSFWNSAERKGYSGVAVYSKFEPDFVQKGMNKKKFDSEGRILRLDFSEYSLLNVYFPNGGMGDLRLKFKLNFYDAFLPHINALRKEGQKIIVCGDYNTAHHEIDLARPKENVNVSGFMPVERLWLDKLVENKYIDTYRHFYKDQVCYTWWDYKTRARERNVGWRIDYFFVEANILKQVKGAFIMTDVPGSDHCPVGIDINIPKIKRKVS